MATTPPSSASLDFTPVISFKMSPFIGQTIPTNQDSHNPPLSLYIVRTQPHAATPTNNNPAKRTPKNTNPIKDISNMNKIKSNSIMKSTALIGLVPIVKGNKHYHKIDTISINYASMVIE